MSSLQFKYTEEALDLLDNLAFILYINNYFSSIIVAQEYVDRIVVQSEDKIINGVFKDSPKALISVGTHYSTVLSTKRTSWHFFFLVKDEKSTCHIYN